MCQIKYLYDVSPVRSGCLLRVIFAEWSRKIHWPFVIDFVEFIPFENVRTMFLCVSFTSTKFFFFFYLRIFPENLIFFSIEAKEFRLRKYIELADFDLKKILG